MTHRRGESNDESAPTETVAESGNPAPEHDQEMDIEPQTIQELPRLSQSLVADVSSAPSPVAGVPPPLSRNPSACSTSSSARPANEYLTAAAVDRRSSKFAQPVDSASQRVTIEPPITKQTLSELDVQKIVHNPRLRHDINFDPELHFRPNMEGEKGRRKQEKMEQYWAMLKEQLTSFAGDREGFIQRYGRNGTWCLPALLQAVKDILQTLVPARDRALLDEGFQVNLLMQQFYHGVADLERLASWLGGVLKLHCAPMRDSWVDRMGIELSEGNRKNDVDLLVAGLRSLLEILEAMKLDVANHQIRCLRTVLIGDTVNFEQKLFMRRIETGKLDVSSATAWYREALAYAERSYADSPMPHLQVFGETAVFFEALSRLVLPSTSSDIPSTFTFDEDRIAKLRSDMHDSICLEICMRKFDDMDRVSRALQFVSNHAAGDQLFGSGSSRSSADFNFNTPASSRPSSLALSDRGSAHFSPRSSGGFFAAPTSLDTTESKSRSQNLYSSLLALLQTAPPASRPTKRWDALAPAVALQIYRYVDSVHCSLPELENRLAECLKDTQGELFREVELAFQQRLLAALATRVQEMKNLNGLSLFLAGTGGRVQGTNLVWQRSSDRDAGLAPQAGSPGDPRDEAGISDMALRLAHLGLLHWRVWGQIAYEMP